MITIVGKSRKEVGRKTGERVKVGRQAPYTTDAGQVTCGIRIAQHVRKFHVPCCMGLGQDSTSSAGISSSKPAFGA